jgi:hypothetical protein
VSTVLSSVAGPPWTEARRGPWPMDKVHSFFLTKIILKAVFPDSFAKEPLGFSKINPQSMISQLDPWFFKNNLVILAPKFSESLILHSMHSFNACLLHFVD